MKTRSLIKNNSKSRAIILHLDGDPKYARKAYSYYNNLNLKAIIESVPESKQCIVIRNLLKKYNPDILVATGHDLMIKKGQGYFDINNYKNSKYFAKTVKEARKWNSDENKFTIIAGACESFFEAIISEGANFASSPGRILIDYKDPLIVANKVANTDRNSVISINEIIPELKSGYKSIGGTKARGCF